MNCCLEDRLDGNWIGTVCEGCKSVAASFAVNRSRDLEAGGLLDEAQEYRQLADTLVRETGPFIHMCAPLAFQPLWSRAASPPSRLSR